MTLSSPYWLVRSSFEHARIGSFVILKLEDSSECSGRLINKDAKVFELSSPYLIEIDQKTHSQVITLSSITKWTLLPYIPEQGQMLLFREGDGPLLPVIFWDDLTLL